MMKKYLEELCDYNLWANTILSAYIKKNDEALLDIPVKSSFPDLRKTIYHIWDAEYIWLERLLGNSINFWPSGRIDPKEKIDSFLTTSENFSRFVHSKPSLFFETTTAYTNLKGEKFIQPNYQIIAHCMNHSSFHRGQLVTILRELNCSSIPSTDMVTYYRFAQKQA